MIPPTPNPIVPVAAPIDMPGVTLWDYAPQWVGLWNQMGDITIGFQLLILIVLLVFGYFFVSFLLRKALKQEEESS